MALEPLCVSPSHSTGTRLRMRGVDNTFVAKGLDPMATLIRFHCPVEAVARGVADVARKHPLGATDESWVPGEDQLWVSCADVHDKSFRKRCYLSLAL